MIKYYILVSIGSIGIGATSVLIIQNLKKEEEIIQPVIIQDQVAKEQQEIIKQLTDIDLLTIPCSKEYLTENSSLLCREMFCRMTTRGIDSKTSGSECEEISNIANTEEIIKACSEYAGTKDDCERLFNQRK